MKHFATYLQEGFLDNDQDKKVTVDSIEAVPETEPDTNPFPEDKEADTTIRDDERDLADEIGTQEADAEKAEEVNLDSLNLDKLEDDVTDSGDEAKANKEAEEQEAELTSTVMTELKDAIATLTTKIEELSDKVENGEKSEDNADDDSSINFDVPAESNDAAAPAEEVSADGAAPAPADEGEAPAKAPADKTAPAPEGEQAPENQGSDEDYEKTPTDNTKSEAYNAHLKAGKILNANSGSLIGKVLNDQLYELQESILHVATAKIRQRIEQRKNELKETHFAEM